MKNILIWLVIVVLLVTVISNFGPHQATVKQYSYSELLNEAKNNNISNVSIQGQTVHGKTTSNTSFTTYLPMMDDLYLLDSLVKSNVTVTGEPPRQDSLLLRIIISWAPFLILIAVWIFFMRQMQGGGGKGGPMAFGKSKARLLGEDQIKVTFADVAGAEEAKHEVTELVDFLRDPGHFQKLGGKMPCGVLLVGSPGTGKTLLARAVAGEAKVPFFTISGSDFVEMFVGVGASRVRDMFEQAKKRAPCIIFIDEIDAVGRHRGAGLGGGHDEREQTLNQMLVEMDGFEGKEGVIVIAATNRPDVLDPALLRPGRFDRQVVVPLPDIKGRAEILNVHMQKIPISEDVKSSVIARGTPGFSGADLANLVNEAALFAARSNKKLVSMHEMEQAKDKIMMGAERKSMVMSDSEKKLTAYHEAGHAIVGLSMPDHDPVYKVTIIPRGRALGVTMFLPEADRYSYSKRRLISQLCSLFGGRLAEEIIFGEEHVTTGASNDIERATDIARNMVTKWGLSAKLGPITYGEDQGEVFLGHSMSGQKQEISDETSLQIDQEVRALIDQSYAAARKVLEDNIEKLHAMAQALIQYETIGEDQMAAIMAGEQVMPPANWEGSELDDAAPQSNDSSQDDSLSSTDNPETNSNVEENHIDSKDSPAD